MEFPSCNRVECNSFSNYCTILTAYQFQLSIDDIAWIVDLMVQIDFDREGWLGLVQWHRQRAFHKNGEVDAVSSTISLGMPRSTSHSTAVQFNLQWQLSRFWNIYTGKTALRYWRDARVLICFSHDVFPLLYSSSTKETSMRQRITKNIPLEIHKTRPCLGTKDEI